jgi:hypothetical protein
MQVGEVYFSGHFHVVVCRSSAGEVVVVSITTHQPRSDTTCVLDLKDYSPHLTNLSVIAYNWARIWDPAQQATFLALADKKPSMRSIAMKRIHAGIHTSDQTKESVQTFVSTHCP